MAQTFSSLSHRTTGILSITGAVALLSFSDALVKAMGDTFGLAQLVLLRSAVAVLAIVTWAALMNLPTRTAWAPWVWVRSLCMTAMWLCYYSALPAMSLALAAVFYYTAPMWMAVLSRLLLKDPVSSVQWGAIALSLLGVVLSLSPGTGALSPIVALPLAAGFFYALSAIVTWSRCARVSPPAMALNLNVTLLTAGGAGVAVLALIDPQSESFALAVWPTLTPRDWALVGALGLLLAVITVGVAKAYRLAPAPIVGVFDTAYLIFAALWGLMIFGEIPTPLQALGMTLIAIGALLTSRQAQT